MPTSLASRAWHFALGLALVVTAASPAAAAPPPPPGGHIPVYFGGANTAGYPPLSPTDVAGPAGAGEAGPLRVTSAPNPFRKETHLTFALAPGEEARLEIFSVEGRSVRRFGVAARPTAGREIAWDGRDHAGTLLPAGVYLYRLEAGSRSVAGKLVYLR
jgi:hypothetical protein